MSDSSQWSSPATRPNSIGPDDEEEFRLAMERYCERSGRMFPTWTEILEVLVSVGYAKRIWKPVGPEAAMTERDAARPA